MAKAHKPSSGQGPQVYEWLRPENLRVYSGIDINEEVTVTGSGPVVEVWSTRSWKKIQNEADQAFANINEVKG